MISGKIAAEVVGEITATKDYSIEACRAYRKWHQRKKEKEERRRGGRRKNELSNESMKLLNYFLLSFFLLSLQLVLQELRCYDSFSYEFLYSAIAARVIYHFPILLDAVAVVGARRGQQFLDFFGEVMTGVKPKSAFLEVSLCCELTLELIRQIYVQFIARKPSLMPQDIGMGIVKQFASKKWINTKNKKTQTKTKQTKKTTARNLYFD